MMVMSEINMCCSGGHFVWIDSWREDDETPKQLREEATEEDALLRVAIESYRKAYQSNPLHYYSGINTMILMQLY